MTDARTPRGGFFAARYEDRELEPLRNALEAAGAQALVFPGPGVVLAAWREFPGQGVWGGEAGAVACDLDLTNRESLEGEAGLSRTETMDSGEMLWSLYRRHGLGFLDRMRGAFAFALWDGRKGELVVATDPFGIRPVVYCPRPGSLAAASRIRGLLVDESIPRDVDPEAVYHYLFFHAVCSPLSIHRGVRKLEPGRGLRFRNRKIESFTHYDIRYRPRCLPLSHWMEAIPREIRRAVGVCTADSDPGTTGCFLSGGTDSSSIAGFCTELSDGPVRTFSIGFDEPGYDELRYARIAAGRFGTEQHERVVTPEDVLRLVDALPEIYDEPFGNASVVPAFYCARLARSAGCDLLLGGDGGDEIFGGNERYVSNLVFENWLRLPEGVRTAWLEPVIDRFPAAGPFAKAKKYVRRANLGNPDRFFSYNLLAENAPSAVFRPGFLDSLDPDCFLEIARAHYDRAAPAHDTNRLLYLDMKLTITDNDLRKVNQTAEAAGLRVRYPFLDRDLVGFASTIPAGDKVRRGRNRYVFKRAMRGILPEEIIRKKKHGMGLPIAVWFRRDPRLKELLQDTLFAGTPLMADYLNPAFLRAMRTSFEEDRTAYYGDNLWVVLMAEQWFRRRRGLEGRAGGEGTGHPWESQAQPPEEERSHA